MTPHAALPRLTRHPRLLGAVVLGVVLGHWLLVDSHRWPRSGQPAAQTPPTGQTPVMTTRSAPGSQPPSLSPTPVPTLASPRPAHRPLPTTAAPVQTLPTLATSAPVSNSPARAPVVIDPVPVRAIGTPPRPFRLPPSQTLQFQAQQGSHSTTAVLHWQQDGSRYALTLEAPGLIQLHSQGRIDAWGLAPERHTERRPPRSERALSMPRSADGSAEAVLYSTRSAPGAWAPGLQDRVSWLVQLPAWLQAASPEALNQPWPLQVAGVAGEMQQWLMQPQPRDDMEDAGLLHYRQTPAQPYDSRLDIWLDARPPHWPARLRWGAYRGEVLELRRLPPTEDSIGGSARR